MPLIEKRYAEALIKISSEQKSVDKTQSELEQAAQFINASLELKTFVNNPSMSSTGKKAIIEKLFGKELDRNTISFLKLLIDKSRINRLDGIVKEFSELADAIRSCINVQITTAVDIDKEQLTRIGKKYKEQYKSKEVKVEHIIDPSIIGGVIVKIGDEMVDSSIRGKLDGMLSALNSAV